MSLRDRCAITGVGQSRQGKLPGVSPIAFQIEASKKAIEDAGLTNRDIDGVIVESPLRGSLRSHALIVADAMGIASNYTATLESEVHCSGAIHTAVAAINAGLCHTVLCAFGEDGASGQYGAFVNPSWDQFETPYGVFGAAAFHALKARRHMHLYGTTSRQLGAISVAFRKHANLNPNAQMYSRPLTIEDHQSSRWIVEPLHLFDCCLTSDGGAAVIVTASERAKGGKQKPVYISGMGQTLNVDLYQGDEISGAKRAGEMAYRMAGIGPGDIDTAQLYDCFTITVLLELEDYGFCKRGEGGPFVESGALELGGQLTTNTAGGLLSEAYMVGWNHLVEGVRQLRGGCGVRQVKDAETAFIGTYSGHFPKMMYTTLILHR